jgi:3-hydroxyacyl-CoA dehydrogenase
LARGRSTIENLLAAQVNKGRLSKDVSAARLELLTSSEDYDDFNDVDLAIEAVFETMAIKETVFKSLDAHCKAGAILATNTSTLDVDRIANATGRPEDVVGLHFFSPAHIMRLLEIVRGQATSHELIASALGFAKQISKTGVVVGNCFGFVGNRMLYGYGREAQLLLLEGAAPEYIDRVLQDWGMAMGPNAVGDLAGLDVGYKVRQERTDAPDDPRYFRIFDKLAEVGRYGQKTQKGIFLYQPGSRKPIPDPEVLAMIEAEAAVLGIQRRDVRPEEIIERCIFALIVEGCRILEDGIALKASDIDVIWASGYGFPRYRGGPMMYADFVGLDRVYERVLQFEETDSHGYWDPPALLPELVKTGTRLATYES